MRTPKNEALNRLINFLRLNYPSLPVDSFKPLNNSPINSNAWLAGFWAGSADGDFSVTISHASGYSTGYRVKIKTKIEQRTNYHRAVDASSGTFSYLDIMTIIAQYFNVNVRHVCRVRSNGEKNSYVVETSGLDSHKIVSSYFLSFPLFSSKYINFLRWLEIHHMQLSGESKTLKGLQHCKEIKNGFNSNLSTQNVTWTHLSKFYI